MFRSIRQPKVVWVPDQRKSEFKEANYRLIKLEGVYENEKITELGIYPLTKAYERRDMLQGANLKPLTVCRFAVRELI